MKSMKLKPLEYAFCNLYARGGYTETECVAMTYIQAGKKPPKNLYIKAKSLLKQDRVIGYIAYMREEIEKVTLVDAVWVRQELVGIVKNGKHTDARGALDLINKMNGYYEKDNQQKQGNVTLEMKF